MGSASACSGSIRPSIPSRCSWVGLILMRWVVVLVVCYSGLGFVPGNVGVFQVTSPNSTDVSDYGVYDTSTLLKDVTAVVNVSFALN